MRLEIETSYYTTHAGSKVVRFRPTLIPDNDDPTVYGAMKFAAYECWENEPETHEQAIANALNNARQIISGWIELLPKL